MSSREIQTENNHKNLFMSLMLKFKADHRYCVIIFLFEGIFLFFSLFIFFSLRPQEIEWNEFVKFYATSDVLIANCVIASAFLTYCGSMTPDARWDFG